MPKKIIPITIGEIIFPNNNPNLNQTLFNGLNIIGFIKLIKKNMAASKIAQILIDSLEKIGQSEIIKKNIENTIPKLLFELIFISFVPIV